MSKAETKLKLEKKPKLAPLKEEDGDDIDLGEIDERPPLIPEGIYEVGYTKVKAKFWCYNHENSLFYFQIITPGEHQGVELFMSCRTSPRKGMKAMAYSSKYARMIRVATAGNPPHRRDRLTPIVFRGKVFKATVRTVTTDGRKQALAAVNHYSVIDMLLEKVTG